MFKNKANICFVLLRFKPLQLAPVCTKLQGLLHAVSRGALLKRRGAPEPSGVLPTSTESGSLGGETRYVYF